jgi:peptidyl-prolyl cis-trans isomerase D
MIHIFRKNQRGLMLIIAILTIVAFIFLYNRGPLDDIAATRNPKIYGQALTPGALERQAKNYQLTLALGQYDLVSKLGGNGEDQASSLSEFVWNLLILQHQARALGVEPTDLQVAERIKEVPVFQTAGQFDPLKYGAFLREQLAPRGFSERQLEEVIRDSLRLERIASIVESPVAVGDAEVREAARVLQPVTAEYIRFSAEEAAKSIQVAPEEIAGFFERNQSNLNTKETRAVRYVAFQLPAGSKLEGRSKVDGLQKLADQATKFADSLAGMPFDQAASSLGLTVGSTSAFDRSGSQPAVQIDAKSVGNLPDILSKIPSKEIVSAVAPAAFLLPAIGKVSDIIQSGDAFYIVELSELNPARPLTLAEATPAIEARLRESKADQALRAGAAGKIQALRAALGSGKKFSEAAKEAGLQVESLNDLAPMGDSLTPEQRRVVSSTLSLKDGELSAFETAPWGGLCVYLQSRGPLPEKELAAKQEEIRQSLLDNKRGLLFAEWLRICREDAKITIPGNNRS